MAAPLSENQIAGVLAAGMTPRAASIATYQRYFDGSVYDGKTKFFDERSDDPITDRAPCVIFPGVRNAVNAISSMCLGDKRFPAMTTLTNEDNSAFDERFGLKEDESETFDALLGSLKDQTRLPAKAMQILEVAMNSGTAVPMAVVIKGRLGIKQLNPKVCWPEFENDGTTLVAIEERYLYEEKVWSETERKWERRVFMYRRRIDTSHDTVFKPFEVTNDRQVPACILTPEGTDPVTGKSFKTDEKTKYKHAFGFCPVLWYRFLETISEASSIDGRPIHWGLTSLCDAVNYGLSQRYRAALYCGAPQPWETGVDEENGVNAPEGRLPSGGGGASLPGYDSGRHSGSSGVRRKGPNSMWSYANPESKVGLLALTGDSLKPLADDVADNRKMLRESLGHVELDTTALSKSELSGAAIEEMKAPQVIICNKVREDFGANCLLPLVNLLLRVALASSNADSKKNGLYLAGINKARPILEKFYQEVTADTAPANDAAPTPNATTATTGPKRIWFDPTIKLTWGAYSEVSDAEKQIRVTMTAMAHDKGFITRKTAVATIKDIFPDIGNVDQYLDTLLVEIAKMRAENDASLHGAIGALNDDGTPQGGEGATGDEGAPGGSTASGTSADAAGSTTTPASGAGSTAASPAPGSSASPTSRAAKAGATPPKPIHDRTVSTAGVTESVYQQLIEDFPSSALGWVRTANWQGPIEVPLDSIDFSNSAEWAATDDPDKVASFVEKIKAGERKPIILVNEPNGDKLLVADGHHRLLAYKQLGLPAYAYVADVGAVTGPWTEMHDSARRKPDDEKKAA